MASLYKQPKSPFWWISYRDPVTNLVTRKSTGLRIGVGADTRRAQQIRAEKSLAECSAASPVVGRWDLWVERFINDQVNGRSRERYLTAWRTLSMFLAEKQIVTPSAATYQNCSEYIAWRETPDQSNGKYKATRNTAILEFKILRWLLREAVKRGYCTSNPAREVVVKRAQRKVFPDYSDDQLQKIWAAIQTEAEPDRTRFANSFAISLLHGVRLNETNINPMTDLNLAGPIPTVRFFQKGGKERLKPLHPQLLPFFKKLQSAKATETYPMTRQDERLKWGNKWTKFWVRHNFKETNPNGCFHSLRITVENVLREAGIPKEIRESYLSHEHGHQDVNASYDRVKVKEMLSCHTPLSRNWLTI